MNSHRFIVDIGCIENMPAFDRFVIVGNFDFKCESTTLFSVHGPLTELRWLLYLGTMIGWTKPEEVSLVLDHLICKWKDKKAAITRNEDYDISSLSRPDLEKLDMGGAEHGVEADC